MKDQSCCFSVTVGNNEANRYGERSSYDMRVLIPESAEDSVIIEERLCQLGLNQVQINAHRHHDGTLANKLF